MTLTDGNLDGSSNNCLWEAAASGLSCPQMPWHKQGGDCPFTDVSLAEDRCNSMRACLPSRYETSGSIPSTEKTYPFG